MIVVKVAGSLCLQGAEGVEAIKAARELSEAIPSLQPAELDKWGSSLCKRGFVAADQSVSGDCLKLLPNDVMARWIAARLGVEFGMADGKALAQKCETIFTGTAAADALTGGVYEAIPTYGPITLVVVDPPFGLNKGQWDKPALGWGHDQFFQFLGFVCRAPATSKEGFCVAVYTTEERLPELEAAFEEAGRDAYKGNLPNGTLYKGCLKFVFVSDGTTGLFAGQMGRGGRQFVCAGKFGEAAPMAERNNMMGKFVYFTSTPRTNSRCGRPEIDTWVRSRRKGHLNRTQKAMDKVRILIRTLAPKKGVILSLCNGTATTQIAAAMEGCSSVGIDSDAEQVAEAVSRLRLFFEREDLLRQVLESDRDPECPATKALQEVAEPHAEEVRSLSNLS